MEPTSQGSGHARHSQTCINLVHEDPALPSQFDDMQFEALQESLVVLQRENNRLVQHNLRLANTIDEVTQERDEEYRQKLQAQIESFIDHRNTVESFKGPQPLSECFTLLQSVEECLMRIDGGLDIGEVSKELIPNNTELNLNISESIEPMSILRHVHALAETVETKVMEQGDKRTKEKQLENSIISLTEENRDISSLLRIALVEKEAAEKSIERLKGGGDQQKRMALLQYAEMGLQKVGFGFIMGSYAGDSTENSSSTSDSMITTCSDTSEEGAYNFTSTLEKMMKDLRHEISDLRHSVEVFRSDNERLHGLVEKQAQEIVDNKLHINELEHKEALLSHKIEELMSELSEAEEDTGRWREACAMEVEAAKSTMEERDRMILGKEGEMEKLKASLQVMESKLKLKEELAKAAMAAEEAAETSLRVCDRRSMQLQQRIEELSRQLEEAEKKGERKYKQRVRHVCWPWPALRNINPTMNQRSSVNYKRLLPEMQALLHTD